MQPLELTVAQKRGRIEEEFLQGDKVRERVTLNGRDIVAGQVQRLHTLQTDECPLIDGPDLVGTQVESPERFETSKGRIQILDRR